jgi:YihY family inner membrane protein
VNPVERVARRLDRLQQQHRVLRAVVAIVKKYGDDRGASLAVMVTYYSFLSLFPLLLVLVTVLGFVGNDRIADTVLGTSLEQFPVVGDQLGRNVDQPLSGSGFALAIGLLLLLYGSLGVAQSLQFAMAQLWNVPGPERPGFLPRVLRGLGLFAVLGTGMAVSGFVSGLATLSGQQPVSRALALTAAVLLNTALFWAVMRIVTPAGPGWRTLVPGALVGGIGYTILLAAGTALVQHQLRNSQPLYGQFAFVLGLLFWLYLVAQLTMFAAETNVVLARRLWPRSLVPPPLTGADEQVLRDLARQEARRPEEQVVVGFASPDDPGPGLPPGGD